MPPESPPRVVAILNSNEDLVRLVRETLHDEGYLTIAHHIRALRDGETNITQFLEDRDPPVIIYDLAPPFTLNWQFLTLLNRHPAMRHRKVILTTNNGNAVKEVLGVDALQIVGQDKDLAALVKAVNGAFTDAKPLKPGQ
jgi:CheY-like chemotaxis protein